jgi:hypothetical protein
MYMQVYRVCVFLHCSVCIHLGFLRALDVVTEKFGDSFVADNNFAIVYPKAEDFLYTMQEKIYDNFFAEERRVHGKIEVESIHKPPVVAQCSKHPNEIVYKDEDNWVCMGHQDGVQCDVRETWQLQVIVREIQQVLAKLIVPEDLVPTLFDGITLHHFYTDFRKYCEVLTRNRFAVLKIKCGVVTAIQHGPYEDETMDC